MLDQAELTQKGISLQSEKNLVICYALCLCVGTFGVKITNLENDIFKKSLKKSQNDPLIFQISIF